MPECSHNARSSRSQQDLLARIFRSIFFNIWHQIRCDAKKKKLKEEKNQNQNDNLDK